MRDEAVWGGWCGAVQCVVEMLCVFWCVVKLLQWGRECKEGIRWV